MFRYIYRIINELNGKYYIGARESRVRPEEDKYMGSGLAIKRAIRKHGRNNFSKEIISVHNNRKELYEAEVKAISDKWMLRECYNLRPGGNGGFTKKLAEDPKWKASHQIGRDRLFADESYRKRLSKGIQKKYDEDDEYKERQAARNRANFNNQAFLSVLTESNRESGKKKRGSKHYNNGIKSIIVMEGDDPPDGFVRGRINVISSINEINKKRTGSKWWNNGSKETLVLKTDTPPDGFTRGRLKRTK